VQNIREEKEEKLLPVLSDELDTMVDEDEGDLDQSCPYRLCGPQAL
jgi:hypothetical protein